MKCPVVFCPPEIRLVADEFKDLLGPHYKAFVAVLCGCLFNLVCLSEIVRYFLFSPSVSSLSRLLDEEDLSRKLNRRHRRKLLRVLKRIHENPSRYLFAIDDTLIPHWGKTIWGAYSWKDHKTNGYVFHKLLVLGVVDTKRKVLIPLFWEILHRQIQKNDHSSESQKSQAPVAPHEKGWEVAMRLLNEAIAFGFPQLPVVLDAWFSGKEFFAQLTEKGFRFVMEIKSNRKVHGHGRQKLDESVAEFFSNRFRHKIHHWGRPKWATSATLQLKEAKQKLKVVAVAEKKGLVHSCFAYYVSNQLTWDANKIWGIARDRWAIEVQFRDLKQHFALGGAAVQSKQAVETSISISMIALTVVRLEQLARVVAKENQEKRPVPVSCIVQEYQRQSLNTGIHKLANSKAESTLMTKFRNRLRLDNFRKKPTTEGKKVA